MKVNTHFIFVEAPMDVVWPEVLKWGEAPWWPEKCSMRFIPQASGQIVEGTRYYQKCSFPLIPAWKVEVTQVVSERLVERTFHSGMLRGSSEVVKVEKQANGVRIEYQLNYEISGLHNLILWPLIYIKLHNKNIELLLRSLKKYVVGVKKETV